MDVLPLGLVGDGALGAAVAADREVNRMAGVRLDHLAEYLAWSVETWVPPVARVPGVEHLIQLGGSGTDRVPEFAVCEVAARLGLSQPAASGLCADVLDLRFRLPRTAAGVRSGLLEWGRARLIARRTRELSLEQAGLVEASVMALLDTARGSMPRAALVPWGRLVTLLDQAVLRARGPEDVAQAQERVARSLFVELYRTQDGGTDLAARLAAADAARLDARLDQVAGWLAQVGDDRPKPVLRAVALGLLADPAMLKALDGMRRENARGDRPGGPEPRERSDVEGESPSTPRIALAFEHAAAAPQDRPPSDDSDPPKCLGAADGPAPPEHLDLAMDSGPPDDPGPPEHLGAADDPGPLDDTDTAGGLGPPGDLGLLGEMAPPGDREPAADLEPPGDLGPPTANEAGVAGLPPPVLDKLAGLRSTVLYVHLDQATGTWRGEGMGALSREQATAIVGHSRVLVRPVLDVAGEYTYTGYAVPPLLREQLALLNAGHCCFPGCGRRARLSEADHRDPHPGGRRGWADAEQTAASGTTRSSNMQPLCKKHPRAKTHTRWRVLSPARGIWVWTSPGNASDLVTNGVTTPVNGTALVGAGAGVEPHLTERRGWVASGDDDTGYTHPADLTRDAAEVTYGYLDVS